MRILIDQGDASVSVRVLHQFTDEYLDVLIADARRRLLLLKEQEVYCEEHLMLDKADEYRRARFSVRARLAAIIRERDGR